MSDFEDTAQALADLLMLNVPGLADATLHLLAPWEPAKLIPDTERHLMVTTTGETPAPESTEPLTLDSMNSVQEYIIRVWEDATTESARGVIDDDAAREWYELQNGIRAMFHPFRTFANVWRVRYRGTVFAERAGAVRVMEMAVTVDAALEFTAPT